MIVFTLCLGHISLVQANSDDALICSDICIRQANFLDFKDCLLTCRNILQQWHDQGIITEDTIPGLWDSRPEEDLSGMNDFDKRQKSAFVRIGKQRSHFLRIGRSVDNNFEGSMADDDDALDKEKRMSSFVRIGKSGQGIGSQDYNRRASSFVRIGKSDPAKRLSSFVRIGKKSSDGDVQGMETDLTDDEKAMENSLEDKYYNDYVDLYKQPKRASSFVRIGKKDDIDDHTMAKRPSSFVRIGRNPDEVFDDGNKRGTSSFVRIGRGGPFSRNAKGGRKRYSSFVRIGKRDDEPEAHKRLSSFVRIGKSSPIDEGAYDALAEENGIDKKASSFVRIGKSQSLTDEEVPFSQEKRMSSFVRIGKSFEDVEPQEDEKRVSSFVRIGKSWDDIPNPQEEKRASSFVRIGKSTSD